MKTSPRTSLHRPPELDCPESGDSTPPFAIAGFSYYDGAALLSDLQPGTALTLRPEPTNRHDPCAVEILHGARKLGYVPRVLSHRLRRFIQHAVPLACEVASIATDAPPWETVAVRISISEPVFEPPFQLSVFPISTLPPPPHAL